MGILKIKQVWLAVVSLFIWSALSIASAGADPSESDLYTIHFKDGTVVTATIRKISSQSIIYRTKDGKEFVNDFDNITSIKQGDALPPSDLERLHADLKILNHRFSIGIAVSDFNYEEPSLMEETGLMYGVIGRYDFRNPMGGMFQTDLQIEWGDLDYDGGLWDGTPLQTETNDYLIEWRAIGGIDYTIGQNLLMTPFLGLGYRYWNDEIEGKYGYEREISYWYIPLGIQALTPLSPWLALGFHLEYDLFLEGKVASHLDDVKDSSLGILYNDQLSGKGFGIRGSMQLRVLTESQVGLIFEPFISYWDMDDSEMELIYYDPSTKEMLVGLEPKNTTLQYGLRVMMEF